MKKKLYICSGILVTALIGAAGMIAMLWYPYTSTAALRACAHAQNQVMQNECYSDRILDILSKRGLSHALNTFEQIYVNDPGYEATCHAFMHLLGKAEYEQYHRSGRIDLSPKTLYCGYGFYHGFMDALVVQSNDLDEARQFCADAGKKLPFPNGYAEGSCYHGIGHGVAEGTPASLRGSAERLSMYGIELCRKVAPNDSALMRCASGVFNAIALMYREDKYGISTTDPFSVCSSGKFSNIEKSSCYDQMNTLALWMADQDILKALAFTSTVKDPLYRKDAIHGIMTLFPHMLLLRKDPDHGRMVHAACDSLPEIYMETCIDATVGGAFEFGMPGTEYAGAVKLCASTYLDPDEARVCYLSTIRNTEAQFGREKAAEICESVTNDLRPAICNAL